MRSMLCFKLEAFDFLDAECRALHAVRHFRNPASDLDAITYSEAFQIACKRIQLPIVASHGFALHALVRQLSGHGHRLALLRRSSTPNGRARRRPGATERKRAS